MKTREITDKDLIVYLVANGVDILAIKKEQGKERSIIYFEDDDKLQQLIINFANKKDQINIAEFIATERRIKTLLCLQKTK